MPANHQLYSEWDSTRFLKWASDIGEATKQVVRRMFESYRIEEQAYKGCLSLLKLSDKYTPERLEDACRIALTKIPNPRYKNIRLILEAGQDKKSSEMSKPNKTDDTSSDKYAIIRGAAYFGGEKHEK